MQAMTDLFRDKLSESDDRSQSSGTSSAPGGSRGDLSTSNATSTSGHELLEEQERMFQNESTQVKRLKRVVLLIMLLAGIAVTTTVYFITSNSEEENFESMYAGAAEKVLGRWNNILRSFPDSAMRQDIPFPWR